MDKEGSSHSFDDNSYEEKDTDSETPKQESGIRITRSRQKEYSLEKPYFPNSESFDQIDGRKNKNRPIMKIHGVSYDANGNLLFAVTRAKSKSFQYITHKKMKEEYPMFLIGFYQRCARVSMEKDQNKS